LRSPIIRVRRKTWCLDVFVRLVDERGVGEYILSGLGSGLVKRGLGRDGHGSSTLGGEDATTLRTSMVVAFEAGLFMKGGGGGGVGDLNPSALRRGRHLAQAPRAVER